MNFGNLLHAPPVARPKLAARPQEHSSWQRLRDLQILREENLAQRQQRQSDVENGRVDPQHTIPYSMVVDPTPAQSEAARAEGAGVTIWDGNEYTCSICLDDMIDHDRVCRLACRHVFHTSCWEGMAGSAADCCPNCRAGTTNTAPTRASATIQHWSRAVGPLRPHNTGGLAHSPSDVPKCGRLAELIHKQRPL